MHNFQSSAGKRETLRTGDAVIVKASGELIKDQTQLARIASFVEHLRAEKIKVIFGFGAGVLLDEHYRRNGMERNRNQGSKESHLYDLEVFDDIHERLERLFDSTHFISPYHVREEDKEIMLRGHIDLFKHDYRKVVLIGFLGWDNRNHNMDDICSALTHQCSGRIREMILLGKHGGVMQGDEMIPRICKSSWEDGAYDFITGGMRHKVEACLCSAVSYPVITSSEKLRQSLFLPEIEGTRIDNTA